MRSIGLFFCSLLTCFSISAQNFGGNPKSVQWQQVNTANARVIFPAGLDSQAARIAVIMKLLGDTTAKTIGGQQKKWNIILQNQNTIPNAYVRLAPVMSELYMTPSQDNFSVGSLRWDDNLLIHENRHMQQFSNFNKGFTKVFSFFLGQEGQLLANGMTVPDYFFEGDAVWQETFVSAQGRGRMPSFYNGFKSLWMDNKQYSWMQLRNGSFKAFIPDHYALGYLLSAYGYEQYGAGFWNKVTDDAIRFKGVFYPFNRAVARYSGKPYKQFCSDAMQYFRVKTRSADTMANTAFNYLTQAEKNNVVDYKYPHFINDDSILVTKKSLKDIPAFYIMTKNNSTKLRIQDLVIDDYFSYKNGKLVYAAYQSDARWANRDYSVIKLYDVYTGLQKQVTHRSKYFSPDINASGSEILAVSVNTNGSNNLERIDASTGKLIQQIPNSKNYFFTQTKYVNEKTAVAAVRNPKGEMALIKIDITNGVTENLTAFSYQVIGYPAVKGDTIYYTAMNGNADKVFAVTLSSKKMFRVTQNTNGVYYPAVNNKGKIIVSVFTAGGYMLAAVEPEKAAWEEINVLQKPPSSIFFDDSLNRVSGFGLLPMLDEKNNQIPVSAYRKSSNLFNFHSRRPVMEDPEYGYHFFSDNILSNFSNSIYYTFNRADRSHNIGFNSVFAGLFPFINAGAEGSFNRTVDSAFGKSVSYNSATLKAGASIPLRFVGGRTNKFVSFGAGYNLEQYYYSGVGKNLFANKAISYMNAFLSFSNVSQQARQHINPRWAQTLSLNFRDAFNFRNSRKLVTHASFYFPGIGRNHSLVINTAYQSRDTLPDLFSKIFSYSRGYEALSTRRMYKMGVNYQLPLLYPDLGFANLLFLQRVRVNAFYDYTNAKARVNQALTEIINSSAGAEIFFDTKIWNAFPVTIGVRYAHLFDKDLLNPTVKNRWEIILPIGLIPN